MWYVYALLCAFLLSAASLVQKKTLMKQHAMEFAASLAMVTMALSVPLLFFVDFTTLNLQVVGIMYAASLLGSIGFLLIAKSVRHLEISEAAPLLVLGPGISALLAFLLLGEKLTFLQMGGIAVLILGSYVLELRNRHDFFHPLRIFKQSKYYYFLIAAITLYAICANFDRIILSRFGVEPLGYIAIVHIFVAFNFLVMISLFHDGIRGIRHGFQNLGVWLLLAGMLTVGYRFAQFEAVKSANIGLVLPVKRMSAFFTTIIGGKMFHEKNLKRKAIACSIMLCGVIMIVL